MSTVHAFELATGAGAVDIEVENEPPVPAMLIPPSILVRSHSSLSVLNPPCRKQSIIVEGDEDAESLSAGGRYLASPTASRLRKYSSARVGGGGGSTETSHTRLVRCDSLLPPYEEKEGEAGMMMGLGEEENEKTTDTASTSSTNVNVNSFVHSDSLSAPDLLLTADEPSLSHRPNVDSDEDEDEDDGKVLIVSVDHCAAKDDNDNNDENSLAPVLLQRDRSYSHSVVQDRPSFLKPLKLTAKENFEQSDESDESNKTPQSVVGGGRSPATSSLMVPSDDAAAASPVNIVQRESGWEVGRRKRRNRNMSMNSKSSKHDTKQTKEM